MWYRFEEGNPFGIPRIDHYQVALYDMEMNGDCFDEAFFDHNEIDEVIPYVETIEDESHNDRSRVFVHFDDGDIYELKLVKIDGGKRCSNFYD